MSEKRFTFGAVSPNVAMIKDNGEPMNIGEVINKLNEQQAEIEKLQKIIDLTTYQLKVQDRIIQKMEENE